MALVLAASFEGTQGAVDLAAGTETLVIVNQGAAEETGTALTTYFPTNNGFLGATSETRLESGQVIDRYGGSEFSRFFSPQGVPDEMRALPPGVADQGLRTFQVMQPFSVESGTVAPAFGQLGWARNFVRHCL